MNDQKSNSPVGSQTRSVSPATPLSAASEIPIHTAEPTSKLDTQNPQSLDKNSDKGSDKGSEESKAREVGGQKGPEPTRYGDWEKNGRCTDF